MRTRFVESGSFDFNNVIITTDPTEIKRKLNESINSVSRLLEAGMDAKAIWEVPVSKCDVENANGRVYSRALWERVINEQEHIWKGSALLLDHPEGDKEGSTRDIGGVWIDSRIDESGIVWGTLVFTEMGKNIEDAVNLGLRMGTSSSGFGELDTDGKTVIPESYEIERLSDAVLNPSQGTYFNITNKIKKEKTSKTVKESIELNSSGEEIKNNIQYTNMLKGKSMKISEVEKRRFQKDMQLFLEDTESIVNPLEKLAEMNEIKSYLEENPEAAGNLKEQIEQKIKIQEAVLGRMIDNAIDLKESFEIDSTETLKKGLLIMNEETKVLKQESKDWEHITKILQENIVKLKAELSSRPSVKYVESLIRKINNTQNLVINAKKTSLNESGKMKGLFIEKNREIARLNSVIAKLREEKGSLVHKIQGLMQEKTSILESKEVLKNNLFSIKKEKLIENKRLREEEEIKSAPKKDILNETLGMNHSEEVKKFYEGSLKIYGRELENFKTKLLECQTLSEAKLTMINIIPELRKDNVIRENLDMNNLSSIHTDEKKALLKESGFRSQSNDGGMMKRLLAKNNLQ